MTREIARALLEKLDSKKVLIFDFDGTLADTSPFHETAFNAVLAPWEIKVDYEAIAGLCTRDALASCFDVAGVNVSVSQLQALTLSKQALVRTLVQKDLRPLPGVDEFLRWARPRYHLALYSSGSRGTITLAMEKIGYTDCFDPIVCAEDVMHAKPDPEGFLRVLELTGSTSQEALVFEDSNNGVAAAVAAKCDVLKITAQTQKGAFVSITDMAWVDLLACIKMRDERRLNNFVSPIA